MDTAQLASIIITVGALLPLLTSVVQRPTWSKQTRTLVGVGMSVLAGIVTYVTQFGLNLSNPEALVSSIVGVVLASGAAYKTVWQPVGAAPALETRTSPAAHTDEPADAEPPSEETDEVDDGEEEAQPRRSAGDDDLPPEDVPENLNPPDGFDDGSKPVS